MINSRNISGLLLIEVSSFYNPLFILYLFYKAQM